MAQSLFTRELDDSVPYFIHRSEGALFLWLWFEGLPITAKELYQRLKKPWGFDRSERVLFLWVAERFKLETHERVYPGELHDGC